MVAQTIHPESCFFFTNLWQRNNERLQTEVVSKSSNPGQTSLKKKVILRHERD
jgi:hypothetical protein